MANEVQILTQAEFEALKEEEMDQTFAALANRPRPYPLPRAIGRKQIENAFLTAFEMIGGRKRLDLWADQNPTEFFKIMARMVPQATDVNVNGKVAHMLVIPPTSLDGWSEEELAKARSGENVVRLPPAKS